MVASNTQSYRYQTYERTAVNASVDKMVDRSRGSNIVNTDSWMHLNRSCNRWDHSQQWIHGVNMVENRTQSSIYQTIESTYVCALLVKMVDRSRSLSIVNADS